MAYSPIAEIYSGYGLIRGQGAYMSLSGYSAPGTAQVGPEVKTAMGALVYRGNGPNGTRHRVNNVPGGSYPPVNQVPLSSTPGAVVARRLGQYGGFPGGMVMRPGTDRAVPSGAGFEMRAPSMRYGLAGWRNLGDYHKEVTIDARTNKHADVDVGGEIVNATIIGTPEGNCEGPGWNWKGQYPNWLWVKKCKATMDVTIKGDDPNGMATGEYAAYLAGIKKFVSDVQSGTIDPSSTLPSSLASVSQPPSGSTAADVAAYNEFVHYRDTTWPIAKRTGAVFWEEAHPSYGSGGATTASGGGSSVVPTTTVATGTIQQGTDGQMYRWDGSQWTLYIQGSGTTTVAAQQPVTTSQNGDPYAESASSMQAGTMIVGQAPLPANAPDEAVAANTPKKAAGIGIVAVIGLGLFLWSKHKKKRAA